MPVSKITSKYQTTVPKEVRRELSVSEEDSLEWKVQDGAAFVRPAASRLLHWVGSIKVGKGSTVQDVKNVRASRGKK